MLVRLLKGFCLTHNYMKVLTDQKKGWEVQLQTAEDELLWAIFPGQSRWLTVFSAFCTYRHPVFDEPLSATHPTSTLTNNDREEMVRKAWPLLASYNHKEYLYPNIIEGPGWKSSVTRSLCSLFTVSDWFEKIQVEQMLHPGWSYYT